MPQKPLRKNKTARRSSESRSKADAELEEVLRCLPGGYNPWHLAGDSWLDHDAARRAINFFPESLCHVEGAAKGDPFILKKWQAAIVGNLFGWKRHDDVGRTVRRYRKSLIFIARGNGKTPLAAGIVLYAFFEDGEPGAQCFLAAGQKEQAGFLFRNARGMVELNGDLLSRATLFTGDQHRSIVLKDDPLSFCKTIPADAAGQHGGIPHITVVDELHVQENRDLLDVFETAMAKKTRSQPLLVMITTADYERVSICNEVYDYAVSVRDNGGDPAKPGFDPEFLPVIYEVPKDADWKEEKNWPLANPNIDVSVDRKSLRTACVKAQNVPAFENAFKRLHLNMRTEQAMRFVPMDAWDACPNDIDIASLDGRVCYMGVDLASTEDLASVALVFPLDEGRLAVICHSFCPEDRAVRRVKQRVPYDVWIRNQQLIATSGNVIDYRVIRETIVALGKKYEVKEIGYDPHGAAQIAQDLQDNDGFDLTNVTQSFANLSAPTKELMRRVKSKKLVHFANPIMRWAATNAAVHFDGKLPANAAQIDDYLDKVPIMLSKRKSADKIDPLAATVLAVARMMQHPEDQSSSVYESRGLLVF